MRQDNIIFAASGDTQHGNLSADPSKLKHLAQLADDSGLAFLLLGQLDAFIAASWLISATKNLGLVPVISATAAQPFHAARSLSAMDILSKGRMGWMPMTAGYDDQAQQFGNLSHLPVNEAYEKATEFVAATEALWDSWDADALIIDKESAVYLDSSKIRRVDFSGTYFQVMGALNSARPLQGHPVLVQDESDPLSGKLGGKTDIILISATDPAVAKRRADILKNGRDIRVLLKMPSNTVADAFDEWHQTAGCDGFHILPDAASGGLAAFLENVVPELRQRGLIADFDAALTLRERFQLPVSVNPYARVGALS